MALFATLLHGRLLRNDRLARVDNQVREAANILLASDLNRYREVEFEKVDKILSDELGESRIGKLFVIRDLSGKIIFQSVGAKLLPIKNIPYDSEWITLYNREKLIRVLNIPLPNIPDRTLQVGLVVDNSLISPAYFSPGNLFFVGSIFLLGWITAWALTSTLLRPISQLVNFISSISPESALALPPLPKELARFKHVPKKRDELRRLVDSFSSLMEKVNRGYKLSRVWSYQMAHELKTPLAIMEGEIANARKTGEIKPELAQALLKELMEASETVTEFLTWAELEGASTQKNLYAVSARTILCDIQRRLANKFNGRLVVNVENDFYVLSNLQHFEHLLMNLVTNALLYSPLGTPVEISSPAPQMIRIADRGPGMPRQVLERIGEPFNRDDSVRSTRTKGHGLGLAYVHSVCKLYAWKIDISSSAQGTEIYLRFPDPAEDSAEEVLPAASVMKERKAGLTLKGNAWEETTQ